MTFHFHQQIVKYLFQKETGHVVKFGRSIRVVLDLAVFRPFLGP